jgi:hypothetical protein
VKSHPDSFALAPEVPQGPPRPHEPHAMSNATFSTADGRLIWRGGRFHLNDQLVLDHPAYFQRIIPRP